MQSLGWYAQRLGRMSAAEIAYRLGGRVTEVARATVSRFVPADTVPAPAQVPQHSPAQFIRVAAVDAAPYIEAADRLLAGEYQIFDLKHCMLGQPPEWNRDPLTRRLAPLSPAHRLDYRDERIVGNIKYLWEPSRHLHLVTLAQAYALTKDLKYARGIEVQLTSWIEQCPQGRGAHWASSLELGIRLINWSLVWQLLGGEQSSLFASIEGRVFRERWLTSVYQHAQAIQNHLSRFSSANNHLVGETAGVWIASVTWPYWPQLQRWGQRCKDILAREALLQNAADGGNREQALAYQTFVLDFLLLAGLAARSCGQDFSQNYWQRIESMVEFIAALRDVAGNVPMIGDADDGYVTRLSQAADFCPYRSLLITGAVLFDRNGLCAGTSLSDDKTRWLLGDYEERLLHAPHMRPNTLRAFTKSGYYLLGNRYCTADEVRLLIDAGPLGYLSLAAHGHADALSVVLNVGGREILIDPGTYAYHTEPQWRRYFRSTAAHNTVTVDDSDQSQQSGNFMWSRHANSQCLDFSEHAGIQRFAGEHDGYTALNDPVKHRREVVYDVARRSFEIVDTLKCAAEHRAARRWHFAETLQPRVDGAVIEVQTEHHIVTFTAMEHPDRVQVFQGGSPEEGGWVSRRFGHKTPCTTVAWESAIDKPAVFRTRIDIRDRSAGDHA